MLERLLIALGVIGVAALVYFLYHAREGRVRAVEDSDHGVLTPAELGVARGFRATLVQFSTPMCAKCPGTRALLHRVIADEDGVAFAEIDAAERLDLAREHHIMRTPTVLVLDHRGAIVARMSGAPTEAQVREALDQAPPAPTEYAI